MRIAIIAGEISGDILGGRLINALKEYYPNALFEGIAGEEMIKAGCSPLHPMELLSVMGYAEVLPRLPKLIQLRKYLIKRWKNNPPDLMIGIDAPDFNLAIEKQLYQSGITTAHYVSPSIWAWKEGRVKKMQGAMNLMLTLFPFEVDFYKKHHVPAVFVGHPLADEIPLNSNKKEARKKLQLPEEAYILAILPGSRMGEIKRLAPDFLKAALELHKKYPEWIFVSPLINQKIEDEFNFIKNEIAPQLPLTYIRGQSRTLMTASDQILLASGTAVLEGMLIGRPMVAAYRVAKLTATIVRFFKMIKSKYYTLPNNLANEYLVPELIQEDVSSENIVKEIEKQIQQKDDDSYLMKRFHEIHITLRQDASKKAAQALVELIKAKKND